jgi:membrane-bound lytic murein transglycosylase D
MSETSPVARPRSRRPIRRFRSRFALAALPPVLVAGGFALPSLFHPSPSFDGATLAPDLPPDLLPPDLPLEMNSRVERWMGEFLQHPESFQVLLDRKARYSSMMRDQLESRGMPEELLYLALIESGYSNGATSAVEAAGVWQIMTPTATALGLRVDHWVDERRDPVRATSAALDYLETLYSQFGSWYLAAAAYNCGPARVARALRSVPEPHGEGVIWEILPKLPPETRQFIPRLVAASLIAGTPEAFGLRAPRGAEYRYDRVFVPGGTSLLTVSRTLGVPSLELRDLNPHLLRGVTPPGVSYPIRVPVGESSRVVASITGKGRRR